MLTREKFNSLPEEGKKECRDTLKVCKEMGQCAPDEWDRIVNFYYEEYNRLPPDWFPYWED